MLSPEQVEGLRAAFLDAGYTTDSVLERLGPSGREGLERHVTVPALESLADADDAQAWLTRLFPLQQPIPSRCADGILDVGALVGAGILAPAQAPGSIGAPRRHGGDTAAVAAGERWGEGPWVKALIGLRPYAFDDEQGRWSGWVAADPVPGLDHGVAPMRPDFVLGVSPASASLAGLTVPDAVGRALDLGAGCGVQTLHLARHAGTVVATDLNPRAVELARLTLALNGLDLPVRAGSLYEPVAGERFDLIVSNPPYVMSPPAPERERLVYREAPFSGDGLVEAVVTGAPDRLEPGGLLQVLANWADTASVPWAERLAGWARRSGCDMWVLRREQLDVHRYIELWLTDAGLDGDPSWHERYRQWLDYFAGLGITGVGMGWVMMRRTGSGEPDVHIEDWPYDIAQPVGPALSEGWRARRYSRMPARELLAGRYTVREGVGQESLGRPGAASPSHIVLRQDFGLKRAMEVDTALGGVIGACDGELSLGVLIEAVAALLDEEPGTLRERLLPGLRQALTEGFIG